MEYLQDIILDLNPNAAPPIIFTKQGDVDSRGLRIYVVDNDKEYDLSRNGVTSAILRVQKPDGTSSINNNTSINNNIVYVYFTEQELLVSGRAIVDLKLCSSTQVLSTLSFFMNIQPSPREPSRALSSDEYAGFSALLSQADAIIESARDWAIGPITPSASEVASATNNARYYSEQAAAALSSMGSMSIAIDTTQIEPGAEPTITREAGTYNFTMVPPVVNIHASGTAEAGNTSSLQVNVSVSDVSAVSGAQIPQLQKKFDFEFIYPSDWGSGGGSTISLYSDFNNPTSIPTGYAADAGAIKSYVTGSTYFNTIFESGIVPLSKGGTGTSATDTASLLSALTAQPAFNNINGTLNSGSTTGSAAGSNIWNIDSSDATIISQLLSIPNMTASAGFICSPNHQGWKTASEVTLYPPTPTNGGLIFYCDEVPTSTIGIVGYWW